MPKLILRGYQVQLQRDQHLTRFHGRSQGGAKSCGQSHCHHCVPIARMREGMTQPRLYEIEFLLERRVASYFSRIDGSESLYKENSTELAVGKTSVWIDFMLGQS